MANKTKILKLLESYWYQVGKKTSNNYNSDFLFNSLLKIEPEYVYKCHKIKT